MIGFIVNFAKKKIDAGVMIQRFKYVYSLWRSYVTYKFLSLGEHI